MSERQKESLRGKKLSSESIEKRTLSRRERYGGKYSSVFHGEQRYGAKNLMSKRVVCIETGVEYPSAADASRETGIDYGHLCANARGKRRSADGTHWKYIDPPKIKKPQRLETRIKRRGGNNGHAKPIMCIETGVVYPASSILADELGVNRPRITKFMKKGGQFRGLHYQYIDKEKNYGTSVTES